MFFTGKAKISMSSKFNVKTASSVYVCYFTMQMFLLRVHKSVCIKCQAYPCHLNELTIKMMGSVIENTFDITVIIATFYISKVCRENLRLKSQDLDYKNSSTHEADVPLRPLGLAHWYLRENGQFLAVCLAIFFHFSPPLTTRDRRDQ